MTLKAELTAQLLSLVGRIAHDELRPWQLRRVAACLAPELALIGDVDSKGAIPPPTLRCLACGEGFAELEALATHGREVHRLGLDGKPILQLVKSR